MKNQRKAFTLVEMLVAIGIIVILVSMITLAVQKVVVSSKTNATKGFLQIGVTLLEEWRRPGATDYPTFPWPLMSPTTPANPLVPGDLSPNGAGLDSEGFQLSRAAIYRMNNQPAVKTLIGKIPATRFIAPTVVFSLPPALPATPPGPGIGYAFKGIFTGQGVATPTRFFICFNGLGIAAASAAPINPNPELWPANYRDYWLESSGSPDIQILKDAWENPTLLIPSCGFQATDLNGDPILVTSDGVKTNNQFFGAKTDDFLTRLVWTTGRTYAVRQIVIAPIAKSPAQWGLFMCASATAPLSAVGNQPETSGGKPLWDRIPAVPFFASAGPDGIFFDPNNPKTLQDNIYSFEN